MVCPRGPPDGARAAPGPRPGAPRRCALGAALAACALLALLAAPVGGAGPDQRDQREAAYDYYRAKRIRAERRYEAYLRDRELLPQRERRQHCHSDGVCHFVGVQVSLMDNHGLVFCHNCPDPHTEGSWIDTWSTANRPGYHIDGELIFAVPNHAEDELLNVVGGAVVLAHRGKASFVQKAKHAQEKGAIGLIIVDDGQCTEAFDCSGWLGSRSLGPLAHRDPRSEWEEIYIPTVLITEAQGRRLISMMELEECDLDGFGFQVYVSE